MTIKTKRIKSKSLEPAQIQEIREFLDSGHSGSEVKKKYGLPYYTISKIKNRSIYAKETHLQSVAPVLQPELPSYMDVLQAIAIELQQLKDENTKLKEQIKILESQKTPDMNDLIALKTEVTDDINEMSRELRSTMKLLQPILDRID